MGRGPACADDADRIVVTLGPHHQDEAASDRADGDESVLRLGMLVIEDLEIIDTGCEELTRFAKPDAMLLSIREVLAVIPLHLHEVSLGAGAAKSMAYSDEPSRKTDQGASGYAESKTM